jgi:hypothetical protein
MFGQVHHVNLGAVGTQWKKIDDASKRSAMPISSSWLSCTRQVAVVADLDHRRAIAPELEAEPTDAFRKRKRYLRST